MYPLFFCLKIPPKRDYVMYQNLGGNTYMKKGEIYYIGHSQNYQGSEQAGGRPAIIVSNNANNSNSTVYEVVYLTTQDKAPLPTHVTIRSSNRVSTALCEQVSSISIDRFGDYIGEVTDEEMKALNIALMISFDLSEPVDTHIKRANTIKSEEPVQNLATMDEALITAEIERDTYKRLYEQLLDKLIESGRV